MIAVDASPLVLGSRRGVARALFELLRGLEQIPCSEPIRLLAPGALPDDVPTLDGVVVRPAPSARAFRREIRTILGDARVLFSPWSAFPAVPNPVVVTIHELPHVQHGAIEGRMRMLRHLAWLRRDRKAAAVIVPSEATRRDVLATGVLEPDRVHVVPNGFDPAPWTNACASVDGPDVVAVGTGAGDGRKKGIDVLFDAIGRLGSRRLHVVVAGSTRRNRPPGVVVRTDVDDAALQGLVAASRVLVHPARAEGFGYTPLEAMAVGVPTVVADAGSLPEVVGDASLLVPAGDPVALAVAIERVLDDESLRRTLVNRGRRRAVAFPPERSARRLLEVLEGVE